MAMTDEINAKVASATAHAAGEGTKVDCVTCHRGVAIPGQLADILEKTIVDQDVDAAIAQYRDLRKRYFGRQAYDFGEDTLLGVAQKAGQLDPEDAIDLLKVNLEFNPISVRSYSAMAAAYQRIYDDEAAIAALEKALQIEPNNGVVQGQMLQLKNYRRRRQMMNGETPKTPPPGPR
jgi:tetratricopeptide (TPR) repeat protein